MLKLDRKDIEDATLAMCDAAQLPLEAQQDDRYSKQVIAFVLALRKNYEREQTYDGLWEQYGLDSCAHNAQNKALRLKHHAGNIESDKGSQYAIKYHDDAMDDALDLINYGAFCARLIDRSARDAGLVVDHG